MSIQQSGHTGASKTKIMVCWLTVLLLVFLCAGCGGQTADTENLNTPEPIDTTPVIIEKVPELVARSNGDALLGAIIPDDGSITYYTAMHGFLRTAEAMGCPAKIYRANTAQLAVEAVDQAISDHCAGLLIWNENDAYAQAIEKAGGAGIPVVTPYYETDNRFVRASVVVDQAGCMEEVARAIAERMVERDCKGGRILVYGQDPMSVYLTFSDAVKAYYPQYSVAYFARTASGKDAAVNELAEYILWNRDVKGLFCTDADGADIAVRARTQAQREFRNNGAPEQREDAANTQAPAGATPVPESLTKAITITIVGTGISERTIELLHEYDIYAFVLEPYYEAAAHSTMVLDQLLRGESAPEVSRLNMPIVRQTALDKYELIYRQVREWFDLDATQTGE